ncbi:inactive serine protease PAMR1-like [Xenopus laevis]|uniref:Inactive serine protease PAMR1-like n=1 Tax=Xenopus laevis TaxID=8355 RepID=A0A8J1MW21_XENLA|nr:inactive serine protease PAMR1-like [Xenopus laevis]
MTCKPVLQHPVSMMVLALQRSQEPISVRVWLGTLGDTVKVETPLHQLYFASFTKEKIDVLPTKKPALPPGELPPGYHHLLTQLQYDCVSPFYRRTRSSRRTCLKTGKWSGRAPSCIPICGKLENFNITQLGGQRWPWQTALYRRLNGVKNASLRKGSWVLVCSGALLN